MNENFGRLVGDYLIQQEIKEERANLSQRLIAFLGTLCLIVLLLIAATWPTGANALPLFQAEADGVRIVLTDEDCRLPAVENLKKRAIWHEKGKVYEGCFGAHPVYPIIMAYFADKTVVVLPVEVFTPVQGA